jgi:hypothetical protein
MWGKRPGEIRLVLDRCKDFKVEGSRPLQISLNYRSSVAWILREALLRSIVVLDLHKVAV